MNKAYSRFATVLFLALSLAGPTQAQPSHGEQIQEMYIAYYGRPADPGGIIFWIGQLEDSGGNLVAIIDAFGTSPEYTSRFADLDSSSLVNNIYLQLLGRNADPEGLSFYQGRLNLGLMTLGSIALNIADGVRAGTGDASLVANRMAVADAYTQAVADGQFTYGQGQIESARDLISAVGDDDSSRITALEEINQIENGDYPANSPVALHGRLHVCDTKLCDEHNQVVQLRGMSTHGIQWYGWGDCLTEASLDALAYDWKADILRISLYVQEDGYETDPVAYTNQVSLLIDEAMERGMYALVDWHQLNPGDPNVNFDLAVQFFTDISQQHADKKHIIYDVANEPNGVSWDDIQSYAMQIIPIVRQYDADAVIMVGTHGWGSLGVSDGRSAQDIVGNPVTIENIMYTFHFYAATHREQAYRDNLVLAAQQLPVFVTEWGTQSASGDGENDFAGAEAYLDILDEYQIGWINWNYSDDARSGAVWNVGSCGADGPWLVSSLKEAGLWVRDKMRNR